MFSYVSLLSTAALGVVSATGGVDVSQRTYTDNWSCMVSNGKSFGVVRVYQSNGKPDSNGPLSINDAWAGGMSYVDGYIFPCYSCGNPAKQMDDTIASLNAGGVRLLGQEAVPSETQLRQAHNGTLGSTVGMLWIDVEGSQYWSSNTQSNVDFIQGMVDEGLKQGVTLGVYTSSSQWGPICGSSTQFKNYPLWYPHYDNSASFSDFVPFGGWNSPAIKQYVGDTTLCSAGVDLNYY